MLGPLREDLSAWRERHPHPTEDAWVFPNTAGAMWSDFVYRNWRRRVFEVAAEAVGLDATPYHLRHSFASVAVSGGASLPLIGGLLGHSQAQTTQRYAHLQADPLHVAAEKASREIEAAMNGKAKPADVVPMERQK